MKKLLNAFKEEARFSAYSLFYFFYPKLCLACNYTTPPIDEWLCLSCKLRLPKTNFHLAKDNAFTERFWGRVKIEAAAGMYYFKKGGRTQNLIHNLKYKKRSQIGVILGNIYGKELKKSPYFQDVEIIVPVPLHWKKLRKRGYNQSSVFAEGLSETMEIPWVVDGLRRNENSESQTKKSKMSRLENVMAVFEVKNRKKLEGKHILLVDDVLTSGATLEACATKILEVPGTKVSLVTIAVAMN